jgi:uncharacterized protein (DUF934 family)
MRTNPLYDPAAGSAGAQKAAPQAVAPRVFSHGRVIAGGYHFVADDAELPDGAVIVPAKRFLAHRAVLLSRDTPIGVRLDTSQSPEILSADLAQLALVEIHIPYFKDGRAFSWARLLRARLQYRGEIRITGHFLPDQIAFFQRVGVDSFVLPEKMTLAQIEKAASYITQVYQPSVDAKPTISDLRMRKHISAIAAE